MREELSENIGQITAFPVRANRPEWDKYMLEQIRSLLDGMNVMWQDIGELFKQEKELIKRLDKRDNDITDALVKVQNWMEQYQPILDVLNEDNDMLKRVKKDGKGQ